MTKNEQINIRCSKETKNRFENLKKHVKHIDITALTVFEDGLTNMENKFYNRNEELNHIRECMEIKEKELQELQNKFSIIDAEIKREQEKYEIDFEDEDIKNAYQELQDEYVKFCDERKGKWHDVGMFIEWRPSSFKDIMEKYDLQKNHKAFTDGFKEFIEKQSNN